jgi:hypothetical protein
METHRNSAHEHQRERARLHRKHSLAPATTDSEGRQQHRQGRGAWHWQGDVPPPSQRTPHSRTSAHTTSMVVLSACVLPCLPSCCPLTWRGVGLLWGVGRLTVCLSSACAADMQCEQQPEGQPCRNDVVEKRHTCACSVCAVCLYAFKPGQRCAATVPLWSANSKSSKGKSAKQKPGRQKGPQRTQEGRKLEASLTSRKTWPHI